MLSLRPLAFLAVLFCSLVAFADDVLVVTKNGYYLLRQDSSGDLSITKIKNVIKLDEPAPTPEPQPNPSLTDRGKAVRDKAAAVQDPKRAETALVLASTYREIAKIPEAVASQTVLVTALKTANDRILAIQGNAAAWQPVRDLLGSQIAAAAQEGASAGDYAKLLGEVADGLDASVPQSFGERAKISPEMKALILEIIKIIIQLLVKPPTP